VPCSAPDRPSVGAGEDPHPDKPLLGRVGPADPREARSRDSGRPAPLGRRYQEARLPGAPGGRPTLIFTPVPRVESSADLL
jgi:hypothetical protein